MIGETQGGVFYWRRTRRLQQSLDDHEAAFYSLFDGHSEFDWLPVDTSANAFKKDLRDKYDVIIMYDFTRDLDEVGKKHLRDFVEREGHSVRPGEIRGARLDEYRPQPLP